MTLDPAADLAALEVALGHRFANPALLEEALTYRSVQTATAARHSRGAPRGFLSYERLEFLGDRVLGLSLAEMLLSRFKREPEGALSRRFAELARKETLAAVAAELDLARHIRLPAIEEQDARTNPSLLSDVCEAVIAALYLDGGMAAAQSLVARFWTPRMEAATAPPKDPKTALQEWAQKRGLPLPSYRLLRTEGPPHQPQFTVAVGVEGFAEAFASGASKRLAEATAAMALLDRLSQQEPT